LFDCKENGQDSGPAPNYKQDTNSGSIVIRPRGEKTKKVLEFAKIEDFFYPPNWKEGDPGGVLLNYKC
jgi:hypothetical protein